MSGYLIIIGLVSGILVGCLIVWLISSTPSAYRIVEKREGAESTFYIQYKPARWPWWLTAKMGGYETGSIPRSFDNRAEATDWIARQKQKRIDRANRTTVIHPVE